MGDYTPVFKPGNAVTFTASAAVTGKQLVEVTGAWTVGPAAAGSQKVVGQAAHDAALGAQVLVHTPGKPVGTAVAAAVIAAGDPLKAAAGGQVAKFVVGTDNDTARIGTALNGAAAAADVDYLPA